jgi:glycosyltransferase involved in cell wall biosynthesis
VTKTTPPSISVIIPTYNRPASLVLTLDALAKQDTLDIEVIVVDDGSQMNLDEIIAQEWPFRFNFLSIRHKGGTFAKNTGASAATGEYLQFIDDDIRVAPNFISVILSEHKSKEKTIGIGNLIDVAKKQETLFSSIPLYSTTQKPCNQTACEIPFFECLGGFFSIKREHFFELGMLEGVGDGWPNWEDVILGYKAYKAGYKFWKSWSAVGWHYDSTLTDIHTARDRWYRASKAAPLLFETCPGLEQQLTMFHNKTPPLWGKEPLPQSLRKILYRSASISPVLRGVNYMADITERFYPQPRILRPLYRWMVGGYMLRGYLDGLQDVNGGNRKHLKKSS